MLLGELVQKIGFDVDAKPLENLHHQLEGVHRAVSLIAGVEVIRGLVEIAERFSHLGEDLEATAISAGLTTEQLQRLQFAASQNAVSSGMLSGAMARLNRSLYAAKEGSKQSLAVFAKLGITQQQLQSFSNSSDALAAIQDAMMGIKDPTERGAVAMQLFGRSASRMIKFLALGSDATKQLGDDAEAMGAVISGDNVKALAEFEDAMSGLGQVMKSFMATIGATFAPVFIEIIHTIEHSWARNMVSMREGLRAFSIKTAFYLGFATESFRILFELVTGFARDHMGLLLFLLKWAPVLFGAAAAFETLVGVIGKASSAFSGLKTIALPAFELMTKALRGLQVVIVLGMESLAQFVAMFSPMLAVRIYNVAAALRALSALRFFIVAVNFGVIVGALAVALHDLYVVLWAGKSFKETWIYQALEYMEQKLAPVSAKLRDFFGIGRNSQMGFDGNAPVSAEQAIASMHHGPMSMAPQLFSGAADMGVKFNPADPTLARSNNVSTSMRLNAPITVNVPPGVSTQDAVRIARDGVGNGLMDVLNATQRGLQPAVAR